MLTGSIMGIHMCIILLVGAIETTNVWMGADKTDLNMYIHNILNSIYG